MNKCPRCGATGLDEAKRNDPKRKDLAPESALCAIECSIEDYLTLRKGAKP